MPAPTGYRAGGSRQRMGPLALTIALHILALALLLFWKTAPIPRMVEQSLTTVFLPEQGKDAAEPAKAQAKSEDKAPDSAQAAPQPKPPVEPVTPVEPPPIPLGPGWLTMSRDEFAAADISKMARASKGGEAGDQGESSAAYGPGDGPGGAQLYNADWFRRPTQAELAGYIPARAPSKGWGLIACQTVPRNRVENCQTLGESPLGSGFGRAVREAAWQFQVLPPRINGKPQVGSWVRIRISYGVEDPAG